MVMVTLDHTVLVDINGKVDGEHWRRDQCGLHLQKNPERTSPPTEYELQQRKFFETVCHKWSHQGFQGTYQDRKSWSVYAEKHPRKNKKGETKIMTPFTAFLSVNIQRLIENQPILWHAPGVEDSPPPPRLEPPSISYENYGWFKCHVWLTFPQAMKILSSTTPPLKDFRLDWSIYPYPYTSYETHRPVAIGWLSNRVLELDFKTYYVPGHSTLKYSRGSRSFLTRKDNRAYGSFCVGS